MGCYFSNRPKVFQDILRRIHRIVDRCAGAEVSI